VKVKSSVELINECKELHRLYATEKPVPIQTNAEDDPIFGLIGTPRNEEDLIHSDPFKAHNKSIISKLSVSQGNKNLFRQLANKLANLKHNEQGRIDAKNERREYLKDKLNHIRLQGKVLKQKVERLVKETRSTKKKNAQKTEFSSEKDSKIDLLIEEVISLVGGWSKNHATLLRNLLARKDQE